MTTERSQVRPFRPEDEPAVVAVWHRSGRSTYTYLPTWQALTLEQAGTVFAEVIKPRCDVWVAVLDDEVVAYLAMRGSYIDRMYVDPAHWRQGWGTRLMTLAKRLSPRGIELHTHQENAAARAFYEGRGFRVVRLGVSPPPESAPDVEYRWRPHDDPNARSVP